ncbi:MAG: hypothetical protein HC929_19735 [Leptolyngbyaceae cyanobacterium SM2_5_2]|nr:hypothetical protein [Leptolyngbyaceae cyanobacterium SM2_5_2]
MTRRCDRNRKRSKRRAICCPTHGCHLESVSPKRSLFADQPAHLQARGMSRKHALMVVASHTAVSLEGEWLEAFWCDECQETTWYHVRKVGDRAYSLSVAPKELWLQAQGVIHPHGNPSVGEFTRRSAYMTGVQGKRQFSFMT